MSSVLQPGEESSAHLHLSHSAHVVSHDFLAQVLALSNDGNFTRLDSFNLLPLVLDLKRLALDVILHIVCLLHISHLNLSCMSIFPFFESHADFISDDTVNCSCHEFLTEFELPDIFPPGSHTVL